MSFHRLPSCTLALGLVFALGACKPELLPGTRIEDNETNRAVVELLANYKSAIEQRSADKLMTLISDDYFEDNGTVDQADDYGVEKLRKDLTSHLNHTKEIKLDLMVQNVVEAEDLLQVDVRFNQRALLALEAGEKWVSYSDVNRLILRKTGEEATDGLVIVSGL